MKQLLITIAAVVLVGCGESQPPETPKAKARVITIHNAVMLKQIAAVKQHLAADTDVNAKNRSGETPLHIAVMHTNPSGLEFLEHMMFEDRDGDGISTLAEKLLGTDENDPDSKPTNDEALEAEKQWEDLKANKELSKKITELLIANGADINAKDDDGATPLDAAIDEDNTELADLLRKHGGKTGEELKAEGK